VSLPSSLLKNCNRQRFFSADMMVPSSWTAAATATLFLLLRPALSQIPPQYASHFLPNTTLQITYGNYTFLDGEILHHTLTASAPVAALLPPPYNETVALVLVDAETNATHWIQTDMRPAGGKNTTLVPQAPAEMEYRPPEKVEIGTERYVFLAFSGRHGKRVGTNWWRSENPVAGTYFKVESKSSDARFLGAGVDFDSWSQMRRARPTPAKRRLLETNPPKQTPQCLSH
jgi:hypothetical protein